MFKKLFIITIVSLSLTACFNFRGATPSQQLSTVEAGFTSVVAGFNSARRPCVTGQGLCLINDDLYIKINPVLQATNNALSTSRNFMEVGQADQAKAWLEKATLNVASLTTFLATINSARVAAENIVGVQ